MVVCADILIGLIATIVDQIADFIVGDARFVVFAEEIVVVVEVVLGFCYEGEVVVVGDGVDSLRVLLETGVELDRPGEGAGRV